MAERLVVLQFEASEPKRLDKFLVGCLPEFSRARLQALIEAGQVWVGDQPARKAGQMLDKPVVVKVNIPPPVPSDLIPENIPLEVVFENADLLVVNKPAGMVVHPSAGHASGTLVHGALALAPEIEGVGGVLRPGVVHRLDKDTSGLIVLAKNDHAHHWLQDQFRTRTTSKVYLALVDGHPPTPTGRVEAPIGRSSSHRQLMAVVPETKGRAATSEYHTLETFSRHTLLEVHPITGRTHQIRVHMAFIGCPVAGDTIYGLHSSTLSIDRHFLHATRLTITLPGETAPRTFEAALPDELEGVLNMLRRAA